jgi:hypothetical protein
MAPLKEPLLNAEVAGQDSVQATIYRNRIHWLWGDTLCVRYPLGHFGTAGAVSELPGQGGLPAHTGIDITYFSDANGFSRPMWPRPGKGMLWTDGLVSVPDRHGREHLVAHYAVMKDLGTMLSHGIGAFNDQTACFEKLIEWPLEKAGKVLHGHAFQHGDYIYFASPFPTLRVRALFEDLLHLEKYELLSPDVAMRDMETGHSIKLHSGSVRWNPYRQKFVMIAVERAGKSMLGEVWYSEASDVMGPWQMARRIVTHDRYSFYNPVHHDFLDEEGGRYIYFEGTYAGTFSGTSSITPRYEYNQIMYRLDLSDPRLPSMNTNETSSTGGC